MTPDLWCFGKVIGGGLPVGAFGGSRDAARRRSRLRGPVYQAGTLSGNPLATAAGTTVLEPRDALATTTNLASASRTSRATLKAAMRERALRPRPPGVR